MRDRHKLALGLLLAALLLYFFVRSSDWHTVLSNMESANPWLLAVVFFGQFPLFYIRAIRWQCFLAPIKKIRISLLVPPMMIGFMISFIFPGRIGEVVRPVLLGIRENISKTSAFATIVLERIFDLLAILILLQVYFLLAPLAGPPAPGSEKWMATIRVWGWVLLLGSAAVVGLMVLFKMKSEFASRLFHRLAGFLPASLQRKAVNFLESFVAGLNVYHDFRTFALIGFYSLALWSGICTSIWICIRAFGIDIPYLMVYPIQSILMVGVAIPTPGMVGGFHATMKIGLVNLCGVDPSRAVSAIIVLHALLITPVILQGLFHTWREGFSLSEIRKLGKKEKALEEDSQPQVTSEQG